MWCCPFFTCVILCFAVLLFLFGLFCSKRMLVIRLISKVLDPISVFIISPCLRYFPYPSSSRFRFSFKYFSSINRFLSSCLREIMFRVSSWKENLPHFIFQPRTVAGFRGTVRYASVNAHKNKVSVYLGWKNSMHYKLIPTWGFCVTSFCQEI